MLNIFMRVPNLHLHVYLIYIDFSLRFNDHNAQFSNELCDV